MARIDLNRIALFVRVVQAGSFTAAGASLGLPTSSVSRAVARLEDDLGARLLHRTTRKLSLTDTGQHYYGRMQTVVAEAEEASAAVAGFEGAPRGLVRVAAPVDLGLTHLPALVKKLIQRHPGLILELVLSSRRADLVEDGIDLAIRGGRLEDSSLVARKIAETELGLFASPAYLQRRGRPRAVKDIARHDCILYGTRAGRLPWRLRGPRGEETARPSGPIIADDMMFVREMVVAGMGIALLPAPTVAAEVVAGRMVRLLPRYAVHGGALYLVWPSRRLVPARVVVVREFLVDELARLTSSSLSR
jgi:DNA-binding transcriptional LysR family regulator